MNARRFLNDQRGAMLMHIAISMLALLAFSALAVDYGIMWAARRQAQNTADSAALTGAVSMAFQAPGDHDRARHHRAVPGQPRYR